MKKQIDKAKLLSSRLGLSEDEAAEALAMAEEDAKNPTALGTSNAQVSIQQVKGILKRIREVDGQIYVSAEQMGDALRADGVDLTTNRHLGDVLGRGPRGLFLESQKGFEGQKKTKTFYKIPDVEEFESWYEAEHGFLPRTYYSESFLRRLLAKEVSRKNSRLLSE